MRSLFPVPSRRMIPFVAFSLVLMMASALSGNAQKPAQKRPEAVVEGSAGSEPNPTTISAAHVQEMEGTVALLPWSYRNGKEAAVQSAQEVCNQLLLETGLNVFLTKSATGAMPPAMPNNDPSKKGVPPFTSLLNDGRALLGQTITGKTQTSYVLPTLEQMIRIGETLQTRYVLAGRAQWSTRNVWVGVANRAKSLCTVDMLILDMKSKSLVLEAHNIEGDSTENKNMFNTVTSAISLNPLPLVLAGSVTPQEQHAVAVAATKAIEPWLRKQRIQAALAQADLSSTASAEAASTSKFSALLSPLTDVQATLHLSDVDQKECASLDSEVARLYALSTLHLDYKEPNHLHLRGTNSQGEPTTLLADEDTRRFTVGEHGKSSVQDLSNAPTRRLSLLDFCGQLTPGMFDAMRASCDRKNWESCRPSYTTCPTGEGMTSRISVSG